jgi:hypothetical protein
MPKTLKLVAGGFFIPMILILAVQTAAPHFITIREIDFPAPVLHEIPYKIGNWQSSGDEALDHNVTEYLRPDEYVLRDYFDRSSGATVNLFVAYFKSLQNAWGPHSPSICLPGAGWLIQSFTETSVDVSGNLPVKPVGNLPVRPVGNQAVRPVENLPVNRYLLEKSGQRILVLYWYQNNRRIWADESEGKFRLLKDLARYRRSDISLVRLVMPIRQGGVNGEFDKSSDFAKAVFPILVERFASSN